MRRLDAEDALFDSLVFSVACLFIALPFWNSASEAASLPASIAASSGSAGGGTFPARICSTAAASLLSSARSEPSNFMAGET